MFAGLKGSDINGRWYSFMQEHLVRPVCAEFRHDLGLPTIEEMPLTQNRSEEHTSELQSLMRISYAVFCSKTTRHTHITHLLQHPHDTPHLQSCVSNYTPP